MRKNKNLPRAGGLLPLKTTANKAGPRILPIAESNILSAAPGENLIFAASTNIPALKF